MVKGVAFSSRWDCFSSLLLVSGELILATSLNSFASQWPYLQMGSDNTCLK